MSQTSTAMTGSEILDGIRAAKEERLRQGLRSGPVYGEAPLVWHDQVFGREETPAGTISCKQALRVGAMQNSLDVLVVASHKNGTKPLVVAKGGSLTLTLLQADAVDGKFEEVGPTVCVTANEATNVESDCLVARFAIGNMTKPWAKVKLDVSGVTGGLIDVALGYVAR